MPMFRRSRFGRKRYGRKYRYKKRRMPPNLKKRVVRTSARAAANPRAPNSMCRDIGTVYPSCMVLKCRQSFFGSLGNTGGILSDGTVAQDKYYTANFRCFPSSATVASGNAGTFGTLAQLVQGSSVVAIPPGLARVFNTAGTQGVYQRACVLSARFHLRCTLQRIVSGEANNTGARWIHILHTRDADGETAPDIKTQAAADLLYCQPDVRRQVKDTTRNLSYVVGAAAGSMNTQTTSQRLNWRQTMWPHKELDQPFENYVAQDASFAVADGLPTNRVNLELRGYGNANGGQWMVENQGCFHCDLVYTLLLKDPFATVT
jgi:hypothetical protein